MLKKLTLVLFVVALASCDNKNSYCPDKVCTADFAMITVRFIDKDGEGVGVKNYSAVNQRTNDTIKTVGNAYILLTKGTHIVVDDSYTEKLSETGDDIKVSGTDSVSNQTKTAIIKVAAGKCACHITKVSGPEQIQFD